MGGAQGLFGVQPDLIVFGRCIPGGYPMAGSVGGCADVIMRFAAGICETGGWAYVGGTLSANPLSCVAGCAGDRLMKGLQAIIENDDLPFVAYNQGSIVHLETSGLMLLDLRNPIRLPPTCHRD